MADRALGDYPPQFRSRTPANAVVNWGHSVMTVVTLATVAQMASSSTSGAVPTI